ncbi:hypothetical protein WA026_016675 [Henosepilachna vigintioctopunctata]|uniref:Uncharacterized protein n=1 Tax=Henosepilachna vigintioctopunctata TaxID=420089 RepID=A0AAW1V2E6_9CUCU
MLPVGDPFRPHFADRRMRSGGRKKKADWRSAIRLVVTRNEPPIERRCINAYYNSLSDECLDIRNDWNAAGIDILYTIESERLQYAGYIVSRHQYVEESVELPAHWKNKNWRTKVFLVNNVPDDTKKLGVEN